MRGTNRFAFLSDSPDALRLMNNIQAWLGIEPDRTAWRERLAAGVGACAAMAGLIALGRHFIGPAAEVFIVPSMGATACLLFATPLAKLSQPWPVVGGHVLSALIGVTCQKLIPDPTLAAGCAVGLAILGMQLLGCLHPPGGATALIAVVAGPKVTGLGYAFAWWPVGANALGMVLFATVFHCGFPSRRYPARWQRASAATRSSPG
jgi:CBS-domain-containing membrane protein